MIWGLRYKSRKFDVPLDVSTQYAKRDRGRLGVPLSEEEQRILQEIEQQLYASDPQLVHEVGATTIYTHAGRNLKWATLGLIGGIVFMVATLTTSPLLSFVGFLAMLGSAIFFERNLRKMGRAGWQEWTSSMRRANLGSQIGNARQRIQDRLNREEE